MESFMAAASSFDFVAGLVIAESALPDVNLAILSRYSAELTLTFNALKSQYETSFLVVEPDDRFQLSSAFQSKYQTYLSLTPSISPVVVKGEGISDSKVEDPVETDGISPVSASADVKSIVATPDVQTQLVSISDALAFSQVKLEKFDGNPLQYNEFVESFTSQIHERATMPVSTKFNHLICHLVGNAKTAVQCFPRDQAGYDQALATLKELFGDRGKIARAHIDKMCNGPQLSIQDPSNIQAFYHSLLAASATFSRLRYYNDVNSTSTMLRVVRRLPVECQQRWRRRVQKLHLRNVDPVFDDIVSFVKEESSFANDCVWSKLSNAKPPKSHAVNTVAAKPANRRSSCIFCNQAHDSSHCPSDSKSYDERVKIIKAERVCFRCFNSGHQSKRCPNSVKCDVSCM